MTDISNSDVELMFARIVLGAKPGQSTLGMKEALDWASRLLNETDERDSTERLQLRLRLALHLSPREAINYTPATPISRHRMIARYITEHFGMTTEQSDKLGRDVARLFQKWEEGRESVYELAASLLGKQGRVCAHCRYPFGTPVASRRDFFKPYHESPDELTSPEVDHIEAISALGGNETDNLQVLCRFCNSGKGDGLGLKFTAELKYAGLQLKEVPLFHRSRLFYSVTLRDQQRCTTCQSTASELTVILLRTDGALVRSNLRTVCISCAN